MMPPARLGLSEAKLVNVQRYPKRPPGMRVIEGGAASTASHRRLPAVAAALASPPSSARSTTATSRSFGGVRRTGGCRRRRSMTWRKRCSSSSTGSCLSSRGGLRYVPGWRGSRGGWWRTTCGNGAISRRETSRSSESPRGRCAAVEAVEQKAALELLDTLLAKMSDEQREVFVLHEIEHLSGVEIAELTETNENTVWTRLRAARRVFQEGVARQRARQSREQA